MFGRKVEVKNDNERLTLFSRYKMELTMQYFGKKEVTGKIIDFRSTFNPTPYYPVAVTKTSLAAFHIYLVVVGVLAQDPSYFWFAFLTNQALTLTALYYVFSWLVILSPPRSNEPTLSMRFTWGLYSVVVPIQIVVGVLYWGVVWTPEDGLSYRNVFVHGVVVLPLLIDGLVLNRTPVRSGHQFLFVLYVLSYLAWTLYHGTQGIGDPTSEDDDLLYADLNWRGDPYMTGGIAAVTLFLIVPLSFGFLWLMSLYSCPCRFDGSNRRFLSSDSSGQSLVDV